MPRFRIKQGQQHYIRFGSGRRGGLKLAKAGDTVELTENQAKAFQDKLDPLEPTVQEQLATKKENEAAKLRVESDGKGHFNVVHTVTGKPINQKPLTRKEAEEVAGFGGEGTAPKT